MENLISEEKIKNKDSIDFNNKLGLMKSLYELAFLYKDGYRSTMPRIDSALLPQDIKDFMTGQGFVFHECYDSENNKLYAFEFNGKVGE